MIWLEKDYVYGGWNIWFGKRGPKYLPDGTKWSSRAVPGHSIGFSLNPLVWLQVLGLLMYRTRWFWYMLGMFLLGYLTCRLLV